VLPDTQPGPATQPQGASRNEPDDIRATAAPSDATGVFDRMTDMRGSCAVTQPLRELRDTTEPTDYRNPVRPLARRAGGSGSDDTW
jgi:hypothetical protein